MLASINPSDLPAPPQTALQVINACSDESFDFDDITKIVSNDPQLTAEILRLVNSVLYSRENKVNSLNQAISIIGMKSIRNLSLCLSIKEVISGSQFDAAFLNDFWSDSIYRAVAARHLSEIIGVEDGDECFTTGLLQDFGLLVMIYMDAEKASSWYALRQLDPNRRLEKELNIFANTHTKVFEFLGHEWGLPDSIVEPIASHHECSHDTEINLCNILNTADWFSYVITSEDIKTASKYCKEYLKETIHFDEDKVDDCLNKISSVVKEVASVLGVTIKEQFEYQDLLKKSNIRLAEDNLQIQELNWKLQATISERDRLSKRLDLELKLATEIQQSLLPSRQDLPFYGFNIPARQLSGDFYDFFKCQDGSIMFCLADVSGKGVNASLLMVKVSSLFHCLGKYVTDMNKLAIMINKELVESNINGMFVTLICGKYNPSSKDIELINAGHPPALIVSDNGAIELKSTSIPFGIDKIDKFEVIKYSLINACLYLFSDGIFEAKFDGVELGVPGLLSWIKSEKSLDSSELLSKLNNKLLKASTDSSDDMTFLILDGRQ